MISENDEDSRATVPHARNYQSEQKPFKEESDQVMVHAGRTSRYARLIRGNLMPERPAAQSGEHKNRMDWASDSAISV